MERLSVLRCCASNQKRCGPNSTDLSATLRNPNSVLGFSWLWDQIMNGSNNQMTGFYMTETLVVKRLT